MYLLPLVPRFVSLALVAWACHATALAQDAAPVGAAEETFDLPARPVPSLDFGPPAPLRALAPRPIVYPAGTFRSPVAHPLRLSGTFGELRANHFHMGLDIKSAHQAVGDPLFSIADGYISRLKVSATGYGNSMYIDHPNGTRAVYAHLDAFPPHIQRFLDSVHYTRESFEIDVRLSPKRFPIAAGDPVGVMGNTGSSQGPHLHLELRLVENDAAFNPLLFDFPVSDHQAPSLRGLVGSSRVDLQACKLEYSIVSPK